MTAGKVTKPFGLLISMLDRGALHGGGPLPRPDQQHSALRQQRLPQQEPRPMVAKLALMYTATCHLATQG